MVCSTVATYVYYRATPQSTTDHVNVYQDSFEQEYRVRVYYVCIVCMCILCVLCVCVCSLLYACVVCICAHAHLYCIFACMCSVCVCVHLSVSIISCCSLLDTSLTCLVMQLTVASLNSVWPCGGDQVASQQWGYIMHPSHTIAGGGACVAGRLHQAQDPGLRPLPIVHDHSSILLGFSHKFIACKSWLGQKVSPIHGIWADSSKL